ncbi:ABC transporter substrate-binding protein [Desmospora activa]|nr:ABC transporter substrate-binding protein [Desmospora activa]
MRMLLLVVLLATLLYGCNYDASSEKKDTLTIWIPFDLDRETMEEFEEEYGVTIDVTILNATDLQVKLTQVLKTQQNVPDIVYLYDSITRRWVESDVTFLDLSEAFPEDIAYYEENFPEHVTALGRNDQGEMKAVGYQNPIGVAYYNRELAKELIGSDDPKKVAEATSSLKRLFALNDQLKEMNVGSQLIGNIEDFQKMYLLKRKEPWVIEDKLIISDEAMELFDISKKMYEENMFAAEVPTDSSYTTGFTEGSFFLDYNPTWKLNTIADLTKETEGYGNWGIANPFIPYHNGGTWIGITKDAKNPKLAWEFVKRVALDEEHLYQDAMKRGDVPANERVMERIVAEERPSDVLGGQDPYAAFHDAAIERSNILTQYDRSINNYFLDVLRQYAVGTTPKDEALTNFKRNVKSAYPDLEVE